MTEADIAEMNRLDWDQKITLSDGRVTPGRNFGHPSDVSTWNACSGPALVATMRESYLDVHDVILRQDKERKIGRGPSRC